MSGLAGSGILRAEFRPGTRIWAQARSPRFQSPRTLRLRPSFALIIGGPCLPLFTSPALAVTCVWRLSKCKKWNADRPPLPQTQQASKHKQLPVWRNGRRKGLKMKVLYNTSRCFAFHFSNVKIGKTFFARCGSCCPKGRGQTPPIKNNPSTQPALSPLQSQRFICHTANRRAFLLAGVDFQRLPEGMTVCH